MKKSTRIQIARIISPVIISFLKLYTVITGTERARIIIVNEHDEILLVRGMIGPKWTLPGGAIEKNESPKQAALRELHEETGMVVDPDNIRLIGVLKGRESPVNYVAHVFYGVVSRQHLPAGLYNPVEIIDVDWFHLEKMPMDRSPIASACLKLLSKHRQI